MASKRELKKKIKRLRREVRRRGRMLGRAAEIFIELSDDLAAAKSRRPHKIAVEHIGGDDDRKKLIDEYQGIVGGAWARVGDILHMQDPAQGWSERLRSMLKILIDAWLDSEHLKQTIQAANQDGWTTDHRQMIVAMAKLRRPWVPSEGDLLRNEVGNTATLQSNISGKGWLVQSWGLTREGAMWNDTLALLRDSRVELVKTADELHEEARQSGNLEVRVTEGGESE